MNLKIIFKLIGISVLAFIFILSLFLNYSFFADDEYYDKDEVTEEYVEDVCSVSGIELYGDLDTYILDDNLDEDGYALYDETASEDIVFSINEANEDDEIKAILIEVDSYGGMPAAAEEIEAAIKRSEKPVIVYIRASGLSAAYWAISGADYIIALPSSDVGSIGVTISYVDNVQKNTTEGLTFNQLSTGKFKDILNSDKPLSYEEKQLIMRDLNIINSNFIKTVSENREIDIDKVEKLADGSSMLGQMALENKLIDQVGTFYDVREFIKNLIGEEVAVCW